MTGKIAVEMIGLDGVEYKEVSKKDTNSNKDFNIVVTSAGSEQSMEQVTKRNKLTFLQNNKENPIWNPQVLGEMEATIAGFEIDDIKTNARKGLRKR